MLNLKHWCKSRMRRAFRGSERRQIGTEERQKRHIHFLFQLPDPSLRPGGATRVEWVRTKRPRSGQLVTRDLQIEAIASKLVPKLSNKMRATIQSSVSSQSGPGVHEWLPGIRKSRTMLAYLRSFHRVNAVALKCFEGHLLVGFEIELSRRPRSLK